MIFDEVTHKVKVDTLSKEDVEEYIGFLEYELGRHSGCITIALGYIKAHLKKTEKVDFYILLRDSAVKRHREDIEEIKKLIAEVGLI